MEMDANEQTGRSNYHHHHLQQHQQQQQPPAWYGGTQHYHPPPALQPMHWHMRHDQGSYSQQPPPPAMYHQPDFYSQHQAYPPTEHQHLQTPQHGQFYAQQNQGWPSNNGWSNQFSYRGPAVGLNQEEDWAAKARAWAAQAQFQPLTTMEQPYPEVLPRADAPHAALQPPGQEVPSSYNHCEVGSGYIQETPSYGPSTTSSFMQDVTSRSAEEDVPSVSFVSNAGSSTSVQHRSHTQPYVSSSFQQDVTSSYGQESFGAVSQGSGNQELYNERQQSPPEALVSQLGQNYQQSSHPPVLAAPEHQQQAHPAFSEPSSHYEFNSQPQFEFQQHKLQEFPLPPSQFMPPSMGMDASESGYGGPPSWPPIVAPGMPFAPMGPGLNGCPITPQFEQHKHSHVQASHQLHGPQSTHMFGQPLGPPHGLGFQPGGPPVGAPFGYGGSPAVGPGPGPGIQPVFIAEGNGHLGVPERPKKAAVPSWLREELLKKRAAAATGGLTSSIDADDIVQANGDEVSITTVPKATRRTDSSGISDSEEDEGEDEVEAARSTAINQEIKRVLTEVLLKVTGNLFDEIAQEVLDEDDENSDDMELHPIAELVTQGMRSMPVEPLDNGVLVRSETSPSPPAAPDPIAPSRILVTPIRKVELTGREDSVSLPSGSPPGNVLGLANYASDDEDACQNGRGTSVPKLEKYVEDAKDRRSINEKVDERPERKQLKVVEAQYSTKESDKKAGKDREEESEKPHKSEKEKGRELDKEREDRKEDRKEKEKDRVRERDKKDKKGRPEQEQKEQKRVGEVMNLCHHGGMGQLKLQPVEAVDKLAGSGQHKLSSLEKASKEKLNNFSETGAVNDKERVGQVNPQCGNSIAHDALKQEVKTLDKAKETEKGGGKHYDKENEILHDKKKKEMYGVSDKAEGKDTCRVRDKNIQEADKRRTQKIGIDRSREKKKEDRNSNRSRGRSITPTNRSHGRSTSSRSHSSSLSPNKDDSPRRRKLQVSKSSKRQSISRSPAVTRGKRCSTSRSPAKSKRRSRSKSPERSKRRINSRSPVRSKHCSTSRSPVRSKRRSNSRSPVRNKRHSTSRSPVRFRRRSSRSRSRSPRSKHFHRRVSPSLSRERDRRRHSRSGSPIRRRRRS